MNITVLKNKINKDDIGKSVYFPMMESDKKSCRQFSDGEILSIEIKKSRFYPLLQKFWATCNLVAQNHKAYPELNDLCNAEAVCEYVKLKVGLVDYRIVVKDHVHIKTKSISYSGMDNAEFKIFFENAIEVLSWMSGISVHDLTVNWSEYESMGGV